MVNNFRNIHNFAGLSFYRCRPIEKLVKTLYADIDDVHLGVSSFLTAVIHVSYPISHFWKLTQF